MVTDRLTDSHTHTHTHGKTTITLCLCTLVNKPYYNTSPWQLILSDVTPDNKNFMILELEAELCHKLDLEER